MHFLDFITKVIYYDTFLNVIYENMLKQLQRVYSAHSYKKNLINNNIIDPQRVSLLKTYHKGNSLLQTWIVLNKIMELRYKIKNKILNNRNSLLEFQN